MDKNNALIALSALAQETRLDIFRTLIEYGNEGIPAGKLGERLEVPHNTLSFHLAHLSHAGLVKSRKEGRSIIYSANCDVADKLVGFLVSNCCIRIKGKSATAASLCCPPKPKSRRKKSS